MVESRRTSTMPRAVHRIAIFFFTAAISTFAVEASQGSAAATACTTNTAVVPLSSLPEASGVAAATGVLWLHNDSGEPVLLAVDPSGKQVGRLSLSGARVDDWEAIASGTCGKGRCLFVGDIGDNEGSRKQITVYRIGEPSQVNGAASAEAIHATYPDGAQDAEALLAAPDGTLFIVTKGDTGPINVYRFPKELRAGGTVRLDRVGALSATQPAGNARITDGAFSPDGKWVVLRTTRALAFYNAEEFVRGQFRPVHQVDLSALKEPQGEAVTFGPGKVVYVAGEGGGKKQPGTLAVLSCAL
jgi:hypothetical protein